MNKYVIIVIVGIVCVVAIVRYARFFNDIKIGKGLAAASVVYSFSPQTPGHRLLIIGDSTAVGTGVTTPTDSIAGKFHRDFPDVEIINISKNGARLSELSGMFNQATGTFDLILIQGGGNDIIHLTPLTHTTTQLDTLFKEAKKRSPVVVSITSGDIGLAPIFPWPLTWWYGYRSKIFLAQFKKIAADNNVGFVDLYQQKRGNDPLRQDVARFYAPDGLHLTSDGYEVWYQKILETLGNENPLVK